MIANHLKSILYLHSIHKILELKWDSLIPFECMSRQQIFPFDFFIVPRRQLVLCSAMLMSSRPQMETHLGKKHSILWAENVSDPLPLFRQRSSKRWNPARLWETTARYENDWQRKLQGDSRGVWSEICISQTACSFHLRIWREKLLQDDGMCPVAGSPPNFRECHDDYHCILAVTSSSSLNVPSDFCNAWIRFFAPKVIYAIYMSIDAVTWMHESLVRVRQIWRAKCRLQGGSCWTSVRCTLRCTT